MLRKYQLIKRLATAVAYQRHSPFSFFIKQNRLFQSSKIFNLPKSNFSSMQNHNPYQEDFYLLAGFSREELAYAQEVMATYTSCEDVRLLDSNEVEWITATLTNFIMAHRNERNYDKALLYIKELQDFQHRRGEKDTINVAKCHHALACDYQDHRDFNKAREYLEDVVRICKGLEDNQETKHVMIQGLNQLGFLYKQMNQAQKGSGGVEYSFGKS